MQRIGAGTVRGELLSGLVQRLLELDDAPFAADADGIRGVLGLLPAAWPTSPASRVTMIRRNG